MIGLDIRYWPIGSFQTGALRPLSRLLTIFKTFICTFSLSNSTQKTYVQDILERKSALVFQYIHDDMGHFYVCGDNVMAVDVRKALSEVLRSKGNMTSPEADRYICSMRVRLTARRKLGQISDRTKAHPMYWRKAKPVQVSPCCVRLPFDFNDVIYEALLHSKLLLLICKIIIHLTCSQMES